MSSYDNLTSIGKWNCIDCFFLATRGRQKQVENTWLTYLYLLKVESAILAQALPHGLLAAHPVLALKRNLLLAPWMRNIQSGSGPVTEHYSSWSGPACYSPSSTSSPSEILPHQSRIVLASADPVGLQPSKETTRITLPCYCLPIRDSCIKL